MPEKEATNFTIIQTALAQFPARLPLHNFLRRIVYAVAIIALMIILPLQAQWQRYNVGTGTAPT